MSDTEVTLVCFDLGRVLIDLADGWADAMAAAGSRWPDKPIDQATRRRMFEVLERMERGQLDAAAFAAAVSEMVNVAAEEIEAGLGCYLRSPMAGIDSLIDALTPLPRVMTACLSNTNATHWAQMHEAGGPHYLGLERLDYRFASHLVGECKPAAGIYEHVEEMTGIEPGRIIFFDDREENVAAAAQRGWRAEQIATDLPTVPQMVAHLRRRGVELDVSDGDVGGGSVAL